VDTTLHTPSYQELPQDGKDKVDAIVAFLSGGTVAEIKKVLTISRMEVEVRGSLSRQSFQLPAQFHSQEK
jgi:hypothetical protein